MPYSVERKGLRGSLDPVPAQKFAPSDVIPHYFRVCIIAQYLFSLLEILASLANLSFFWRTIITFYAKHVEILQYKSTKTIDIILRVL